ncbi:MAG: hypothetical protein JXM79_17300 [Sedimentisphaerales bacterium]|nr:hypothetical protein [Sedimentisphaerales bacterium]
MKRLMLALVCLFLITPSQAEEKKNGQTREIQYQLKIQEERLKNIEEQASKELQQIEAWYADSLIELRRLAERKAKQLKLDHRALWAEFIKMKEQTPQFDTYFKMNDQLPNAQGYFMNTTLIFLRDVETFELRAALADSYFLGAVADLLMDSHFCKLLANLANGSAYNPQSLPIRHQARTLLHLANDFQSKLEALQHRRSVRLAAVERRTQLLKEDVFRITREIKIAPETVNEGVVSAIMYSRNSPLCMVDGIDKILREGDSIGNIVIVKIHPDHVQFAKEEQKWTQQVGKAASNFWK